MMNTVSAATCAGRFSESESFALQRAKLSLQQQQQQRERTDLEEDVRKGRDRVPVRRRCGSRSECVALHAFSQQSGLIPDLSKRSFNGCRAAVSLRTCSCAFACCATKRLGKLSACRPLLGPSLSLHSPVAALRALRDTTGNGGILQRCARQHHGAPDGR